MTEQTPHSTPVGFLIGIALMVFCAPLVALVTGWIAPDSAALVLVAIGLVQLVWVVPAIVIAVRKGQRGIARGIAILAAVVFLLNAGCWGLVAVSFGLH